MIDWYIVFLCFALYVVNGWVLFRNMRAWAIENGHPEMQYHRVSFGFAVVWSLVWAPSFAVILVRLARDAIRARRAQ
jgi:hypothetical protein